MDRQEITRILNSAGLRPQHQFGQNFMVDQNILRAIADSGEIQKGDVILEVGPGVGNLTRQISERAGEEGAVLAVDIDYKLMPAAQRHHTALTNVHWLNTDVLAGKHEVEPRVLEKLRELRAARPAGQLKLVSNLPYNAASPLVAELLVASWKELKASAIDGSSPLVFDRLAFTVQWEVGLRMDAEPGTRDYGALGILIQSMADVEIMRKIPAGAFWPPPKISSGLIVVKTSREKMSRVRNAVGLQLLLQGLFSHRRQTLGNGLKHFSGERWTAALKERVAGEFDLQLRAESLPVAAFLRLEALIAETQ